MGVSPVFKHSLAEGTVNGVKNTGKMTVMMYDILKKLVTGEVSVKELSGPVGIVYAVNDTGEGRGHICDLSVGAAESEPGDHETCFDFRHWTEADSCSSW